MYNPLTNTVTVETENQEVIMMSVFDDLEIGDEEIETPIFLRRQAD